MSITPLPVHMSCYGISSDAVAMARGYSKPSTLGDRLASVKAALCTSITEPASSQHATASPGPGPRPAASSPTRQVPQVKLQPLSAQNAQQHLSSGGGPGSSPGPPASSASPGAAAAAAAASNLAYRSHTTHAKNLEPTLQALDFISIAVNSVGGGGVPRPYGKFTACRAGDGNATWQRLPPPPGSWQSRALPIAVTLLGDNPHFPQPAPAPAGAGAGANTPRSHNQFRAATGSGSGSSAGGGGGGGFGGFVRHPSPLGRQTSSRRSLDACLGASSSNPPPAGPRASSHITAVEPGEAGAAGDVAGLRLGFGTPDRDPRRSHGHSPGGLSGPHANSSSNNNNTALSRTYPGPARSRSTAASAPRGVGGGVGAGAPFSTLGRERGPHRATAGGMVASAPTIAATPVPARVLHEQSYYRRPGSSQHRSLVPLQPPEPHNLAAWFALPAATFLAEVPHVPEQLRMDNGYSVSRGFLLSGLNPPRPRPPPPSPPFSAPHPPPPPPPQPPAQQSDPQEHQQQQQQPQQLLQPSSDALPPQPYPHHLQPPHPYLPPPPSDRQLQQPDGRDKAAALGFHHPHPELRVGDRRKLWEALEKGGQAANQGQHLPGHGPRQLRGVYVPLDRRPPHGEEAGQQGGQGYEAGSGLLAGSGSLRSSLQFPLETSLPRRNVPVGW